MIDRSKLSRLLGASRYLHAVFALIFLLSSALLLWQPKLAWLPEWAADAALPGMIVTCCFLGSVILAAAVMLYYLVTLRYTPSLIHLLYWLASWGIAAGLWVTIALVADTPPLPLPRDTNPIQNNDILYNAGDRLRGPSSLCLHIGDADVQTSTVALTPNLSRLEQEHTDLLEQYLSRAPRWSHTPRTQAFHTEPGHMMVCLPTRNNTLRVVHANFCSLENGSELPKGYIVVKPGDRMPSPAASGESMPDIAIDLGGRHYLQLAARGMQNAEECKQALNAALQAIDASMQELAEKPDEATIEAMCNGQRSIAGSTPELRVSEPLTQVGVYQAEIYCNTREPGLLTLVISDLSNNEMLRIFNCEARFSDEKDILFRHDIPGDALLPEPLRKTGKQQHANLPLFIIKKGEAHNFFGVSFEVWFRPSDKDHPKQLILRRCYRVQPFPTAPAATGISEPPSRNPGSDNPGSDNPGDREAASQHEQPGAIFFPSSDECSTQIKEVIRQWRQARQHAQDKPEEAPADTAQPADKPEAAPKPEAVAQPEAAPEPKSTAQPEATAQPAAAAQPEAAPEPKATAQPAAAPEPAAATPRPEAEAQPAATPERETAAQPAAAAQAEAAPVSASEA